MSKAVLIVDDDKEIAALLALYLKNEGYRTLLAHDGEEALILMRQEQVDLLVLDVMMPKKDGLAVCREVRKNQTTPILMLSAKVEDTDKILGLMTGADDYMEKPFNPLELVARIKALFRRSGIVEASQDMDKLQVHGLVLDRKNHTAEVAGIYLKLTRIEFDILYLLASSLGRVYSSEDIFEYVWQEKSLGTSKTVMVHVSNLREKLEQATKGEKIIETVWGVGYKIAK